MGRWLGANTGERCVYSVCPAPNNHSYCMKLCSEHLSTFLKCLQIFTNRSDSLSSHDMSPGKTLPAVSCYQWSAMGFTMSVWTTVGVAKIKYHPGLVALFPPPSNTRHSPISTSTALAWCVWCSIFFCRNVQRTEIVCFYFFNFGPQHNMLIRIGSNKGVLSWFLLSWINTAEKLHSHETTHHNGVFFILFWNTG